MGDGGGESDAQSKLEAEQTAELKENTRLLKIKRTAIAKQRVAAARTTQTSGGLVGGNTATSGSPVSPTGTLLGGIGRAPFNPKNRGGIF